MTGIQYTHSPAQSVVDDDIKLFARHAADACWWSRRGALYGQLAAISVGRSLGRAEMVARRLPAGVYRERARVLVRAIERATMASLWLTGGVLDV